MANKRMFDSSIIESDDFMLLTPDAQAYYIQCNFKADDRGYIRGARALERSYKEGVLKELIDKRFILERPKELYIIKHFLIHNYIRPEILEETKQINDFKELFINPNGSYTDQEKENTLPIKYLLENKLSLYSGKPLRKGKVRKGKRSKDKNNNINNMNNNNLFMDCAENEHDPEMEENIRIAKTKWINE